MISFSAWVSRVSAWALLLLGLVDAGVTAWRDPLEFAFEDGQFQAVGFHLGEEASQRAEDQLHAIAVAAVFADPLDLLAAGAAAVIAYAVECQCVSEAGEGRLDAAFDVLDQVLDAAGAVGDGDVGCGDALAVGGPPGEQFGGQGSGGALRPAPGNLVDAGRPQHARQRGGVAEAVDLVADRHIEAEVLAEPRAADLALLDERFGGGHVGVSLDPPAGDGLPTACLDKTADPFEQVGAEDADLFVDPGFAARDDQFRVFVEQVAGGTAGVDRFVDASGPGPHPDGVNVGVGDHVHGEFGGHCDRSLPVCDIRYVMR